MRFLHPAIIVVLALVFGPGDRPHLAVARESVEDGSLLSLRRSMVENPRPGWFLVQACQSEAEAERVYCTGYVEGAALIWKRWAACGSDDAGERDFCEGAEAVEARLAAYLAQCDDCSYETFRPEMADGRAKTAAFEARMRRLPSEIAAVLDGCPRTQTGPSERFCAAYDLWSETEIIEYSILYDPKRIRDPGALGRGDGAGDAALHLFFSAEMFDLQTCVTSRTGAGEMRRALLDFTRRYPDQETGTSAVILLGRALQDGLCETGGGARPHMESCLTWLYEAGRYVARNRCEAAVSVKFMAAARPEGTEGLVQGGDVFHTGLSREEIASGWWMFTACPEGHVASVPFEPGSEAISASRYRCLPR